MNSIPTRNNNQRSSRQRNTSNQLVPTEDPVPKSAGQGKKDNVRKGNISAVKKEINQIEQGRK